MQSVPIAQMFIIKAEKVVIAALALNNRDFENISKYRNPYEIFYVILKSLATPHSKTFIMYEAKTTWKQLDRYFEFLLKRGLIKKTEKTQGGKLVKVYSYQTTPKGKELLAAIDKVKSFVD